VRTRTFTAALAITLPLLAAGSALWLAHALARGIGDGSDVLGYDAAQYAVAARELAEHGRLATPFALPVELAHSGKPPWPLSLVQPGLVLAEAAPFRIFGYTPPGRAGMLVLVLPFLCYLGAGLAAAFATWRLIARQVPDVSPVAAAFAAFTVGLALLLDPEAQHYATGGFTELPFTLGLVIALAAIARGPRRRAFAYGLLLGVTGLFRGNMLWLAPALALAFAWGSPRGPRAFIAALGGFALVLCPWWFYKWRAFGNPAWDLSALSIWDGIAGRTWFSLNHLPQLPDLPHGVEAAIALERKIVHNLRTLLLEIAIGPRTLWIAGLAVALFGGGAAAARDPGDSSAAGRGSHPALDDPGEPVGVGRGPRAAALAALLVLALTLFSTAATVPLFRYLLPARLIAEAAGLVAVWSFLWNLPSEWAPPRAKRVLCVALALLALAWGTWQTVVGLRETARVAGDRGLPSRAAFEEIARSLDAELRPNEPVMSNLGPTLAWYTRRPVLHLALTPGDVERCRERLELDEVLVVFRHASRAWPGWDELMAQPLEAPHHREWNVRRVRAWNVREGFDVVWLELGPPRTPMASGEAPTRR
jgi:hypothetical protein